MSQSRKHVELSNSQCNALSHVAVPDQSGPISIDIIKGGISIQVDSIVSIFHHISIDLMKLRSIDETIRIFVKILVSP